MTIEEVKKFLSDVRHAKQRARAINARIAELYGFGVNIKSSLNNAVGRGKGSVSSPTEELAGRILTEQERLAMALEQVFALEDKLRKAIADLSPLEQDVITGYYLDGKTHYKVAEELSYSQSYIEQLKRRAIKKLTSIF